MMEPSSDIGYIPSNRTEVQDYAASACIMLGPLFTEKKTTGLSLKRV